MKMKTTLIFSDSTIVYEELVATDLECFKSQQFISCMIMELREYDMAYAFYKTCFIDGN